VFHTGRTGLNGVGPCGDPAGRTGLCGAHEGARRRALQGAWGRIARGHTGHKAPFECTGCARRYAPLLRAGPRSQHFYNSGAHQRLRPSLTQCGFDRPPNKCADSPPPQAFPGRSKRAWVAPVARSTVKPRQLATRMGKISPGLRPHESLTARGRNW
jgi:hypothetical protein